MHRRALVLALPELALALAGRVVLEVVEGNREVLRVDRELRVDRDDDPSQGGLLSPADVAQKQKDWTPHPLGRSRPGHACLPWHAPAAALLLGAERGG